MIRPAITLYGEQLPQASVTEARKAIKEADCLIIAGTSLQVYPAAEYISDFEGKHIIVINKEPLNMCYGYDDIEINEDMSEVFRYIKDIIENEKVKEIDKKEEKAYDR